MLRPEHWESTNAKKTILTTDLQLLRMTGAAAFLRRKGAGAAGEKGAVFGYSFIIRGASPQAAEAAAWLPAPPDHTSVFINLLSQSVPEIAPIGANAANAAKQKNKEKASGACAV